MKTRPISSPVLLSFAVLAGAGAAVAPSLAAPADALRPAASTNVLTQTGKAPPVLTLTPAVASVKTAAPAAASVKLLVPAVPPAPAAKRMHVPRVPDYRYSNPSRWNSEATSNSIRNQ